MPEFMLSTGWFLTAIFAYGIAILIGVGVRSATYRKRRYDYYGRRYIYSKRTRRQSVIAVAAGVMSFLAFVAVFNFVTYVASSDGQTDDLNRVSAMKSFGFVPGETYPVVLGSRLGATEITGSRFTIRSVSTSILSVAFSSGKNSYILELPINKLTFVKRPGPPTMLLRAGVPINDYSYGKITLTANGYCRLVFDSALAACRYASFTEKRTVSKETVESGLPALMENIVESGVIGLPEDMFSQVLGKTG